MITLICVRRAGDPPPPEELVASGGRPVRLVEAGPLGAWVCDGTLTRDLDGVRAHDAVMRAALRSATPLPVRFGTAFADLGSLLAMLEEREGDFLTSLERVTGKVEMGLRLTWVDDGGGRERPRASTPSVSSGREYLEARRRERKVSEALRVRAEEIVAGLEARIACPAMDSARQLAPQPGVAALVAHLVQRQGVGHYRERVEAARSAYPEVELHLTGPWAPYSFV